MGSSRTFQGNIPIAAASEPATPRGDRAAATPRVGLVTHYMLPHIGGIETQAEAIFNNYRDAGLEVRWVASRVPADARARDDGRIRVPCCNLPESRLGVPWPIWGPQGIREIANLVRWADVIHVHDCLYLGSALAVLWARRAGKPAILSQHIGFVEYSSVLLNRIQRLAYQTLGRLVLSRAAHIVCCTPAAEEFVTAQVDKPAATRSVIPYGTDTQRFRRASAAERADARRQLRVPEGKTVVLFVGRLVEKKGVSLFLEVCKRTPSHHFLMIGDGPLRGTLPLERDNLTWHPFIAADDMPVVYHAADVFLLPSHGEGFPLAIHEAMAASLPVIAPRGEAFTDVLASQQACVVADLAAGPLCAALAQLTQSPDLAFAIGTRSGILVEREWSLQAMGARYLSLVRHLTEKD